MNSTPSAARVSPGPSSSDPASRRLASLVCGLVVLSGCPTRQPPPFDVPAPDDSESCSPGESLQDDGACLPAGLPPEAACFPGEVATGVGCRPAGVPESECDDGFEPDGQHGCRALLPEEPCPEGMMALPGELECHAVAPCAPGTWGDIPLEQDTELVDPTYPGDDSDGSMQKPWKLIKDAIEAAAPGAIVALAPGSYVEDLDIYEKPVRLWGKCPAEVEVVGTQAGEATIRVFYHASGTELHNLAVRGPKTALTASGVSDLLLEGTWIHHAGSGGVTMFDNLGPASMTLRHTLIESVSAQSLYLEGSSAILEGVTIRDAQAGEGLTATGVALVHSGGPDGASSAEIRSSVIERNQEYGIMVRGSTLLLDHSVVRGSIPGDVGAGGRGVNALYAKGQRASLTIRGSVLDSNHEVSVLAQGSDATIENTTVRGAASVFDRAPGIVAQPLGGERAHLLVASCAVDQSNIVGVLVAASDASVSGTVVRGTTTFGATPDLFVTGIAATFFGGARASLDLQDTLVEDNQGAGLFVQGSDAVVEGILVRGTSPDPNAPPGFPGFGIAADEDQDTGERSNLVLRGSVVDETLGVGVAVQASDAVLEQSVIQRSLNDPGEEAGIGVQIVDGLDGRRSTAAVLSCIVEQHEGNAVLITGSEALLASSVIRDIQPASQGGFGRGVTAQVDTSTFERANVVVEWTLIERAHDVGVFAVDSDIVVDHCDIHDIEPRALDGGFGDGISVYSFAQPATARITSCNIARAARAGIANFDAHITVGDTTIECTGFEMEGGGKAEYTNLGNNRCGCDGELHDCSVSSSNLEPPQVSSD